MKITDTLIQKFLSNQCTASEAESVAGHFKSHPELLNSYTQASWDAAGKETGVPSGYGEEMRIAINAAIGTRVSAKRFHWLAAAASLLVMAGAAAWLFFPKSKTASQSIAKANNQVTVPAIWKTQVNRFAKAIIIKMQDGSVVKLAPKAVIKYQDPFGQQRQRNIYMEGEADFDVAHNKDKPFIVHTKLFSVTALGTFFRVSETMATYSVKLFQGKVLVKCPGKLKGWKEDIILLPGNEMKYNSDEGIVHVSSFNSAVAKQNSQTRSNESPDKNDGAIVFNNAPLTDVTEALASRYHTPISYEKELLQGKYFSGEVRKSDSLFVLLQVIANMNRLQVTKKEDAYIITQTN